MGVVDSRHRSFDVAFTSRELTGVSSCDVEVTALLAAGVGWEIVMFSFRQLWGSSLRCCRGGDSCSVSLVDELEVWAVVCCWEQTLGAWHAWSDNPALEPLRLSLRKVSSASFWCEADSSWTLSSNLISNWTKLSKCCSALHTKALAVAAMSPSSGIMFSSSDLESELCFSLYWS